MTELHDFFIKCLTTLSQQFAKGLKSLQEQFDALASDWLRRDERWERSLRSIEKRVQALESPEKSKDE
jgi:hypothetical protein